MRLFGWTYPAALKYVSDRREVACPNQGFDDLLIAFEKNGFSFNEEIIDNKVVSEKSNNSDNDLKCIIK